MTSEGMKESRKTEVLSGSTLSVDMSILSDFVNGLDSGCGNWFGEGEDSSSGSGTNQHLIVPTSTSDCSSANMDSGNSEKGGTSSNMSVDRTDF